MWAALAGGGCPIFGLIHPQLPLQPLSASKMGQNGAVCVPGVLWLAASPHTGLAEVRVSLSPAWAGGHSSSRPSCCSSALSPSSPGGGGDCPAVPRTEQCQGAHTGSGLSRPDACTEPVGAARPARRRWQPSHLPHQRSTKVFPVTVSSRKKWGKAVCSLKPH